MIKIFIAGLLARMRRAHKSAVILFNTLAGLALYNLQTVVDVLSGAQSLLSPEDYRCVAWVIVGINLVLRFKTSKPLSEK